MFLTIFDVKRVCMKATFRVYLLCQQYYSNCYTANGIIFIFVFCFVLRKEYYGDQILGREGSAHAVVEGLPASIPSLIVQIHYSYRCLNG